MSQDSYNFGRDLEKFLVKHIPEARLVPRSGAGKWDKGDVSTPDLLFDAKRTSKETYSLNVKLWRELAKNARSKGKDPSMVISFKNDADKLVVLDFDFFLSLLVLAEAGKKKVEFDDEGSD